MTDEQRQNWERLVERQRDPLTRELPHDADAILAADNELTTLRAKLAEAEQECDDWQGCVEAIETVLTGDKLVPPASIQASCITAAENAQARIRDLEWQNNELKYRLRAWQDAEAERKAEVAATERAEEAERG